MTIMTDFYSHKSAKTHKRKIAICFLPALLLLTVFKAAYGGMADDERKTAADSAGVDLYPSAINITADSVVSGGNLNVTVSVVNPGGAPIADSVFFLRLYLSRDPIITLDDSYIETQIIPALAAGDSRTFNISATIPVAVEPGGYYLGAIIDTANSEAQSTPLTGATINIIRDVDMVMTALTTSAEWLPIGGQITLADTVKNVGTTPTTTAPITVSFYLSTDKIITTRDTLIGSRSIFSFLPAGQSNSAETLLTIPAFTTPDSLFSQTWAHYNRQTTRPNFVPENYYLGAIVDSDNFQPEHNETNNVLTGMPLQTLRDVDLIVTAVTMATTTLPVGGRVKLTNTVKNQGETPMTTRTVVGTYLSKDATITPSDILLGSRAIIFVAAGASDSAEMIIDIPANLALSAYYLGAVVDVSDLQPERNEDNNALTGARLKAVHDADLTVTDVTTAAKTLPVGGRIKVENTVKHQGTMPMTTAVGIYLSVDATITPSDTLLGSRAIPSLAAGASDSAEMIIDIPANLAPDIYYLGAVVDPGNLQPENNETNNALTGALLKAVRDVDLTVTNVKSTARTRPVGGKIRLANTVKNQGATPMTTHTLVGIYLSADATITLSDILLDARVIVPLAAGASDSAEMIIGIPANLAPGAYYLGAVVDPGNLQPENNETNNVLTGARLTITP